MVQLFMQIESNEAGGCPEWSMVELQGDLETKSKAISLSGKFIGDMHFTPKGVPVLVIGHHILYGKTTQLEKPMIAIVKNTTPQEEGIVAMDTDQTNAGNAAYLVKAVIKKKYLFKVRPKPIITNVPKKV